MDRELKAFLSPWKQGRVFVDCPVPYTTVLLDSAGWRRNHGAYGWQKHSCDRSCQIKG